MASRAQADRLDSDGGGEPGSVSDQDDGAAVPDRAATAKPKNKRGATFTPSERRQLSASWAAISEDSVVGTDQDAPTMWPISEHYTSALGPGCTHRTGASLQTRWSGLRLSVSKFCAELDKVRREERSGSSPESEMREAQFRYQDSCKGPFKEMDSWKLLKDHPKFIVRVISWE